MLLEAFIKLWQEQSELNTRGLFFHVTARGNERKRIFFKKIDYLRFKDIVDPKNETMS
jgi:REP element-mobilizing transposase RayT